MKNRKNEINDKVKREDRDGDDSGGGGYDNILDESNRHPRHLHPETTIKLKNEENKDDDDKDDDDKKTVNDEDDGRQRRKRQEEGAGGWFIVRQLRLPMKNRKDVIFFNAPTSFGNNWEEGGDNKVESEERDGCGRGHRS
jgi:hypothetical protein